ncbi:MAG: NifB/NifX family molybdenum-iron cluster-binding protein, partial [Clostridia bacterium]|nr:NifB/NifX family molybdenum-iron cluster-binding protein [Clostridia bacterium]
VAVDPRFGRCAYLIIVDEETGESTVLENANIGATSGAGVATAEALVREGVRVVLTGNCGPKAYQILAAAGVKVVTGVQGRVQEAIESYQAGRFKADGGPSVGAHFGSGAGFGGGAGPMGRGGGRGRLGR